MDRPRLLDLFCGAGGSAVGYTRAGFHVEGYDIKPQPRYPYPLYQADVVNTWFDFSKYDAIHASPPCQAYTTMANRARGEHADLLSEIRERLLSSGLPYIIENVPGARRKLDNPVLLAGGMFGLRVYRPRIFEVSFNSLLPPPERPVKNPIGVYGKLDGRRLWTRADGTEQRAASSLQEAREAMGIDWMEWDELREAIPPAYTEWIGRQLIAALQRAA